MSQLDLIYRIVAIIFPLFSIVATVLDIALSVTGISIPETLGLPISYAGTYSDSTDAVLTRGAHDRN